MVYLHKSVFQSHGYLSSDKCHVDSRWVLKISGFALHGFRKEVYREQVNKPFSLRLYFRNIFLFYFSLYNSKIGVISSDLAPSFLGDVCSLTNNVAASAVSKVSLFYFYLIFFHYGSLARSY